MEYRQLGNSGLNVPVFSFGTATFGGTTDFFKKWGEVDEKEAKRLIDICLDHGINFFDTANVYSLGASEQILGKALMKRRDQALISTKATFSMGNGVNDSGSSRYHLIRECEVSLRRLGTDYIDVFFIHGVDPLTPEEETLRALDDLVTSGKVRYIGCSNLPAWRVIKSLSISERLNLHKYIIYQGYYSLIGRDYESELMPLMKDQHVGLMAWSPLGWGRLTGKIKRGKILADGRIKAGGSTGGPDVDENILENVIDALGQVEQDTGKSIPQIALNWLLGRETVSNIVIGARNEEQLVANLGALGWSLSEKHRSLLDQVSEQKKPYPHWVGMR
jgi:aryl-alcohol dehydrogenase-like predicted oxidoreductase